MTSLSLQNSVQKKAHELGISEDIIACALDMLSKNRDLVNAIDHRVEMDDYIYQAIIRQSADKRKRKAEQDFEAADETIQLQAEKELSVLSREELTSDPF